MDLDKIRALAELLKEYNLAEIETETEEGFIHIRAKEVQALAPQVSIPSQIVSANSERVVNRADKDVSGLIEVTSPMVGTFYRAPAPDADPYVKEGDMVKEGQVLCIIEAMKLMNEIKSEVSGVIEKILVENAQPVEYGQVLFLIKPA